MLSKSFFKTIINFFSGVILMLLLFTTPQCPNCPTVKDFLELKGIDFEIVDATTGGGLEKAAQYGVSAVPTLVQIEQDELKDMARGLEEIEALVDHI